MATRLHHIMPGSQLHSVRGDYYRRYYIRWNIGSDIFIDSGDNSNAHNATSTLKLETGVC